MSEPFGKWWPCLRKHYKRIHVWLPRAQQLQIALAKRRPFRYFTLCARPMIDVYMLVRAGILPRDDETRRVQGVSFCECDPEIFPEMKELIGVEEAGFLAKLEDLVLFSDIPATQTLESDDALTRVLEEGGEGLNEVVRAKVEEKKQHIQFQRFFPFDFLNLDFCDRYYGDPPDVMRIHGTIEKLLDWQRQPGKTTSGDDFFVNRFVVAITCRFDLGTPTDALTRLKRIVEANRMDYESYRKALQDRAVENLDSWATESPLDFFMSAWPKEIARLARQKAWNIIIHDHAFYDRQADSGENYHMVCLVVEFEQTPICNTYLSAVTRCLDIGAREEIGRFEPTNGEGVRLLANLREIVELRNTQAGDFARSLLPDPLAEINRLRAEGVPI
jgi:hypothetical protein